MPSIHYSKIIGELKSKIHDVKESEQYFEVMVFGRWLRRVWQKKYVSKIQHEDVVKNVKTDGRLTSRYSFMVGMSCAIATLGLLLSSPAVVIGAMLISPLMSPIMSLGFSLCVLDLRQMKKALEGIGAGLGMALLMSSLIVWLSPITEATPEIMARTQPNLFDLLVAIFSGLAGGYAVIKRKGEAIVGVAIATALMPPLCVVGYGIATASGPIAGGAFMLFMTNLLAISLSVTLLAKFYGFGTNHSPKHTTWQMALIASVFTVLSIPLGVALKDIAYQTYVTKTAKQTIKEYFGAEKTRLSIFNIRFDDEGKSTIDTVVLTSNYKARAQAELANTLQEKLDDKVSLTVDQIVVSKESLDDTKLKPEKENALTLSVPQQTAVISRTQEMTSKLKQAAFFPTDYVKVNVDSRLASIYPKRIRGVTLATLHQFELNMAERYPDWTIQVVPPPQGLPPIFFEIGQTLASGDEEAKLNDIIWALQRWEVQRAVVVGFASTAGEFEQFNNTSLAYRRASAIQKALQQAGMNAESRSEYRSFKQRRDERHFGINSFQRVEVRLVEPLEPGYDTLQEAEPLPEAENTAQTVDENTSEHVNETSAAEVQEEAEPIEPGASGEVLENGDTKIAGNDSKPASVAVDAIKDNTADKEAAGETTVKEVEESSEAKGLVSEAKQQE